MKTKDNFLPSILCFSILSLGIALQIKAGIGQSVLNALALKLSDLFGLEIGSVLNIINTIFFISYLYMKNFQIDKYDILQIITTILNGIFINIFLYIVFKNLIITFYPLKILVFILGIFLSSISLGAVLALGVLKFPLESFCLILVERLGRKLADVRLIFDSLFILCILGLSLIFGGRLYIREGTVISFFLLSKLVGYSYDFFKRSFNYV